MKGNFEDQFRDFVKQFGGEVLPGSDAESADFFFREFEIVSELKTLQADARLQHATKLQTLADDWRRRGLMIAYGRPRISLRTLNPICQREWLRLLQAPIERIIRKANRQIRSTKQSLGCENAQGLLLVANDGNFLHTSPIDYMNLVARILQKKKSTGERQFSHVSGVVYFSFHVLSRDEGMPFWVPGTIEATGDCRLREFLERLKAGWFSYVSKLRGQPTIEFPMTTDLTCI
jgi:hypothetical protein